MFNLRRAHARQVLLRKLGRRRGGEGLERRDTRAEGAREQAECSQALDVLFVLCTVFALLFSVPPMEPTVGLR